jgi:hypothetical protein
MAESDRNGATLERDHRPNIPEDGAKVRLLTFDRLDGRCTAARRVRETETAIAEDLGGADRLSEAQRQLTRRAAILGAVLESAEVAWFGGQTFDLNQYLATTNCFRRVLRTLGLERRTRPANLIEMMGEADG